MAQLRTTGIEQELVDGQAADAVGTAEERRRVEEERAEERARSLERLERESREEQDRG